jgi:hypothetical protein
MLFSLPFCKTVQRVIPAGPDHMIMNLSAGAQEQPVFLKALANCTIKLQ